MLRRQKDTDAARRKKTGRPIFRTIFNAMMLVTLVEVVLLAVSIAITNVDGRLNQNAKDMLNMQVRNRVSYVQDLMQDAQNLTDLSEHINNTVLAMQEEGQLNRRTAHGHCAGIGEHPASKTGQWHLCGTEHRESAQP